METLETAQLQERGATAERSSPGLCPSLCRLLEQNTTDWELRNDGNVSLTVVESGRPRSKSQHSQVLLRKRQWISPPMEYLISLIDRLKPGQAAEEANA